MKLRNLSFGLAFSGLFLNPLAGNVLVDDFSGAASADSLSEWRSSTVEGNLAARDGRLHLFNAESGRRHALRHFGAVALAEGERLVFSFELSFPKPTGSLNHSLRFGLFHLQNEIPDGKNPVVPGEGYLVAIGNHNDRKSLSLDILSRSSETNASVITAGGYHRRGTSSVYKGASMQMGETYSVQLSVERMADSKVAVQMKVEGGSIADCTHGVIVDEPLVYQFDTVAFAINAIEGERKGGFPEAEFSKIKVQHLRIKAEAGE